jgi:DNA repair exonuclease SbcCD ATPase subunit
LLESVQLANEELRSQISEREHLIQECEAEKQRLAHEIDERDTLIEDLKDEKQQLSVELAKRATEAETLQQHFNEVTKENKRSISALQIANKAEEEELGKAAQQLKSARKAIGRLQNENERLTAALREKEVELLHVKSLSQTQIEDETSTLRQTIDQLRSESEAKQTMIGRLRTLLREQTNENQQQAAILDTVEKQYRGLSGEFAEQCDSSFRDVTPRRNTRDWNTSDSFEASPARTSESATKVRR